MQSIGQNGNYHIPLGIHIQVGPGKTSVTKTLIRIEFSELYPIASALSPVFDCVVIESCIQFRMVSTQEGLPKGKDILRR